MYAEYLSIQLMYRYRIWLVGKIHTLLNIYLNLKIKQ